MGGMVLLFVVLIVVAVQAIPWVASWAAHWLRGCTSLTSLAEPRSSVRVLRGEDELEEAMGRALAYEQAAQEAIVRRIERYRSSEGEHQAAITGLHPRPSGLPGVPTPCRLAPTSRYDRSGRRAHAGPWRRLSIRISPGATGRPSRTTSSARR